MKKIISIALVISLLMMLGLTSLAGNLIAGTTFIYDDARVRLELVELADNKVELTGVLEGQMDIGGFSFAAAYDATVLTPVQFADGATPIVAKDAPIKTGTSLAFSDISGLTGWEYTQRVVDPVATEKYISFGIGKLSGSNNTILVSGETKKIFKMKFVKIAGKTITDSVLTIKKPASTVYDPKVANGTVTVKYSGTANGTNIISPTTFTKKLSYTVTFKDWDGTPIGTPQTIVSGGSATAPSNPTREGFNFTGWDKTFDNITNVTTVTAQYTEAVTTKTVTYATTGSTSGSAPTQVDTAPGAKFTIAAGTLVKDRYTLTGWSYNSTNYAIGDEFTMPSANVTFTPIWTAKTGSELPIKGGEVAQGDGTGSKDSANNLLKYKDKETGDEIAINKFVVSIPASVPVGVTAEDCFDGLNRDSAKFGIIFGGQRFPSLSTIGALNANNGRYFIKLVDPDNILTKKTFKAKTYFGNDVSDTEIDITIN